jgi:hypothetical protein
MTQLLTRVGPTPEKLRKNSKPSLKNTKSLAFYANCTKRANATGAASTGGGVI